MTSARRGVPLLETERLVLTIPQREAAPRLHAYARDNRERLAPWEPPYADDYFTESYWKRRLELDRDEYARDVSMRLCIFEKGAALGPVVGRANFSNIVRSAFQACTLGYSLDARAEGKGYMTEALGAAIAHAFGALGLHRVMANYMPINERSGLLLRRLGFVVEGYARDYLYIGDGWKDHVLTALTSPSAPPPTSR
ncbi:MAG TPA: GNAT family N-acetyltransferase [Minicystis sp.]|nr:GNAT family N-acetyltransferase [Minicystis sp.]